MKFVADLHLHSKYSRAVSQAMVLSKMAQWALYKGINVLATGDFTHPFWFETLKKELVEAGKGLYKLKSTVHSSQFTGKNSEPLAVNREPVYFLLSCEISSIYSQGDKVRRIHNLFFFPSLASVEKFNNELMKRGANLRSDGRPIVGITARDLAEIALNVDQKALIVPAHIWTPWFSVFGSFSGFDSLEECFSDMTEHIYGIETGLSSDPAMNWRIADLDNRSILSFSDAHSLEKMGREATVFEGKELSYEAIHEAIVSSSKEKARGPVTSFPPASAQSSKPSQPSESSQPSDLRAVGSPSTGATPRARIAFTIEFYPEEGKYHYTGHRDCNYSQGPGDAKGGGTTCPVCRRPLTVGVMDRVEKLATQNSRLAGRQAKLKTQNINGVRWIYPQDSDQPPYVPLVPLGEILAEALGSAVGTKKVTEAYMTLVINLGSEFNVLLKSTLPEISKFAVPKVVEAIEKVRTGDIAIDAGYDGKFGVVKIWPESGVGPEVKQEEKQLNLFA